jgi:hypothetical protein
LVEFDYLLFMETLLVSGQTLQGWDIDDILTDNTSDKTTKDLYSEMIYDLDVYRKHRREMYDTYYLLDRIRKK